MRFFVTNHINAIWNKHFPLATFLINISGAFFLGFLYAAVRPHNPLDILLRNAIGIGFIGAYTTFSTMMYETVTLFDLRQFKTMSLYLLASLLFGLLGAKLGASI
ncbi:hypothetical protein BM613_03315 [Sulfoacidibacillus thermotolerans]|uniref:Fluoride-specific ion channel FluC n=2 Tax=Sulfoacidibacillus thermotolerans TaxID=1765684 RepID=A0A2U3DBD6_SULT2|nr:hypothetical protein BM613_03315 [Sulfoacidibacillus thermotolerans]